jgi:hypothetical protein
MIVDSRYLRRAEMDSQILLGREVGEVLGKKRRGTVGLALGSGRSLDEIVQSKEWNGMQQHACPN